MTATEEALAAMAKAEEAWNKMVDERVQVSGQFVKDGEEFFANYQGQAVLVHETFQENNSAWVSFSDGEEKEVSLESLNIPQ